MFLICNKQSKYSHGIVLHKKTQIKTEIKWTIVHFESDGKDFPKKTVIHNNAAFIARSILNTFAQMSWHVRLGKNSTFSSS